MTRRDSKNRPSSPPARPGGSQAELLAELRAIYKSVDLAFAGWGCPASTECCRFGVTGREPYVTSIELSAIERAIRALGGVRALSSMRRSTPEGSSPRAVGKRRLGLYESERACPLLTDAGRCSIYAERPLGCRTFHCERANAGAPVPHREITSFVRRIQDLAARHCQGGDHGRPLTRALPDGT